METLAQFDVLVPAFQQIAANTGTDDLDRQTPCEQWKVRDLFDHLIGGATLFAALVRGEEPPAPASPADAARPATASAAIADVDAAFRLPGSLEKTLATPFGEMPGDTFARFLAFDLLMHTWDLARATGQTLSVPDDVVREVDQFARAALQPEMRGPETFGPERDAVAGAAPLDRLAAFSGRRV